MKKKEIQAKVRDMLAAGVAKSAVFGLFSGKGMRDSRLAYLIASYVDERRCDEHDGKINVLIGIMFVQALIAFLPGFAIGASIGPNAKWIIGGFVASIPLLFAWGFYKHKVGAYNAYLLLSLVHLPKTVKGWDEDPIVASIALVVNLSILAFVWYVREKLFPDFAFITPKKIKGKYVFAD
ncbi:MAG TPA: hypothetical protein VIG66_02480 [Noviherbaspirillum sp.]